MQFTLSDAYATHPGTGNRLHSDAGPVDTVWSAQDANMIIWSLMRLLSDAGVSAATFNPDDANTFNRVSLAVLERARSLFTGSGNVLLAANGFQRLPSGVIVQWGTYTTGITAGGSPAVITLPLAFPAACRMVQATPLNTAPDGSADAWPTIRAKSTTTITIGADWAGTGGTDTVAGFDWLAVGH